MKEHRQNLIICGDTHGTIDTDKLFAFFAKKENNHYNKNDYLLIAGDVGACGFEDHIETMTRKILDMLPVKVLFIDGNHENFEKLNNLPIEEWHGGKTHKITDNIRHLMRGQVFEIAGKKVFTFGGGLSIDKQYRIPGISWFPEEMPTNNEYEEGINNLEKNDWKVNYIITHTGPREIVENELGYTGSISEEEIPLRQYLSRIMQFTEFDNWYFGHFHEDKTIHTKEHTFHCMYNDVFDITKPEKMTRKKSLKEIDNMFNSNETTDEPQP